VHRCRRKAAHGYFVVSGQRDRRRLLARPRFHAVDELLQGIAPCARPVGQAFDPLDLAVGLGQALLELEYAPRVRRHQVLIAQVALTDGPARAIVFEIGVRRRPASLRFLHQRKGGRLTDGIAQGGD
jgi:hypothetical protein